MGVVFLLSAVQLFFPAVLLLLVLLLLLLLLPLVLLLLLSAILLLIHLETLLALMSDSLRRGSITGFSGFIPGLENDRTEIAENHCCRHAACRSRKAAGKNPNPAVLVDGFLDTLRQIIAKAGEGNGCARSTPFPDGGIKAQSAQNYTGHHIAHQNFCRSQLGFVDQNLSNGAENAAAKKSIQIFHHIHPLSMEIATAWQMEGMDSPC